MFSNKWSIDKCINKLAMYPKYFDYINYRSVNVQVRVVANVKGIKICFNLKIN